jgi:hypothetical protein
VTGARGRKDRTGRAGRRLRASCLAASVAVGICSTTGLIPSAEAASVSRAPEAPLESTWTTSQGSWAVVAMGHFDQANNTFWQLWFRPAGTSRWTLVTPPGVATNGGLSADPEPTVAVTVGVEPSQELTYSPVAQTTDAGKTWAPGVLPAGLLPVPDAVTTEPGGTVLALVQRDGATLLRDSGSLTRWTTVTTASSLGATAAGRACGVVGLRAIGGGTGTPELAAACSKPGVVGIFSLQGGSWVLTGPRLTGISAHRTADVLRLDSGSSGTVALIEVGSGRAATLLGAWRSPSSGGWSVSAPVRLRGQVLSTGFGGAQAIVVVTGRSRRAEGVLAVAGPGSAWSRLRDPPAATAAVVDATGTFDALAVSRSTLVDWRLDAATGDWKPGTPITAPIDYGSST